MGGCSLCTHVAGGGVAGGQELSPQPVLLSWKIQAPYTRTHPCTTCLVYIPLSMTSHVVFRVATQPLKPSLHISRPHISPTNIFIPFPCCENFMLLHPLFSNHQEVYIRLVQREGGRLHFCSFLAPPCSSPGFHLKALKEPGYSVREEGSHCVRGWRG